MLKTLDTMGPLHGYGIARRIEQMSANVMRLSQGSIYPALIRLEQRGWIKTKWGVSETNRKVKFYSLTRTGAMQLQVEVASWEQTLCARVTRAGGQGMSLRRLVHRLLALVRRDRLDRELDDEVQAHLELAEQDALARGLSRRGGAARGATCLRRHPADEGVHRDDRSARWIEHVIGDIRYGIVSLRRDPSFTLVAISVLALGIGANTAMFSLVDGVLFRPLPFPDPERIVRVWETPTATTTNSDHHGTSSSSSRSQSFEALSAESNSTATVEVNGIPTRLNGRYVSADHFSVFGIQPLLGRNFRPEEDQPGADRVVVLSHAAWQTHFGADPGVLGRTILLDNDPHEVIGVLPPGAFDRCARGRSTIPPASGG